MLELNEIFLKLFNMSISASWLALAVALFRLVMKKAPKWLNCCLWALVGIRLINPFSFESVLSLIPSAQTVTSESFFYSQTPTITTGVKSFNHYVNPIISESLAPTPGASVNPAQILGFVLSAVWLVGVVGMLLYALISFLRLKRTVSASVLVKENIYMCDEVKTPFILGIIKPKIYIPSDMDEKALDYVIAHEKAHIKRKDYLWKPTSFILLSVYWFNPVLWLSYILLCRDIELACDEKVIRDMQTGDKKAYSEALLSCSAPQRKITACPVAFGEVGVRQRIKSVLNYKKPAFWVILVALIASVAIGVCFMTDPVVGKEGKQNITIYDIDETVFSLHDSIMGASTFTVKTYEGDFYGAFYGNETDEIREFLQSIRLSEVKNFKIDFNMLEVYTDAVIEFQADSQESVTTINFYDDYTRLYLQKDSGDFAEQSKVYEVLNVDLVRKFFLPEELKYEGTVWQHFGKGDNVHIFLEKGYSVSSFETSDGIINKIVSDDGLEGIAWRPDAKSGELFSAEIKISGINNGEKTDFIVTATKVGEAGKRASYYYLIDSEEYTVTACDESNCEFILKADEKDISKPQRVDCYDDNTFFWTYNPMAGGTWWYMLTFTVPDGYDIVSAEVTGGSANVEELYYGEPDGEKCVKWSPDFNEKPSNAEDTILTVGASKNGEQFYMQIKVSLLGIDGESGVKEYSIEPLNCTITEKQTASYEIKPLPVKDLDTAVSQAILYINSDKNWLGECSSEGHIILGKEEEKDVTKVYLLERFSSYGFENGWFIELGGHSTACVMSFAKMDGGYVFWSADYTMDGAKLDDSIKEMFPKHLRKRALNPTDADSKSMDEQCRKYAEAYLKEKGRSEKIGEYSDIPRVWLTDLGVSVEVSNKLLEMKGMTNACEVGYYEKDGVTYRTSYCEEEKIIIYTQSHPEKPNFECTAIDAETGKEVPFKDEYLEKARTYEDYMAEGFGKKQQEYTTKAVVV